eukprot:TRINITY_DN19300_c0_g1_i2.p1 TRINITY_DN19300_c0_g1~~TRINITY_DN19300_c0_g1_i2.p1  ORF type:complete len:640 (-),score=101.96 TRINITY_DN19300_c0_g1_i2:86-2005(-)
MPIPRFKCLLASLAAVTNGPLAAAALEANPPVLPQDTITVDPTQEQIDKVFNVMGPELLGHFRQERHLFLFTPGDQIHQVDVKLGYYTSAAGLGEHRDDVKIKNLYVGDGSPGAGALNNFWRSAENFRVTNPMGLQGDKVVPGNIYAGKLVFAVSQASPIRNVAIDGELWLFELEKLGPGDPTSGMASGGFAANIEANSILTGGQQQFYFRNLKLVNDGSQQPVFNGLIMGSEGNMRSDGKEQTSFTNVPKTPVIAEKPFIFKRAGKFFMRVPDLQRDSVGISSMAGRDIAFEHVYTATPDKAGELNSKVDDPDVHAIWFTPGNYAIDKTLLIDRDNFVMLGHAAYLQQPKDQSATIKVTVKGARVAGLTFEARASPGKTHKSEPMLWIDGEGSADNPTVLSDIFVRIGRFYNDKHLPMDEFAKLQVTADTSMYVNQNHVVADHFWMWKADHENLADPRETKLYWYQTKQGDNPANHGVIVGGNDVIFYGAHVEHYDMEEVRWIGDNGKMYFLQNEWNYAMDQDDTNVKSAAVVVLGQNFEGYALGSYCNFVHEHPAPVIAPYGFLVPADARLKNLLVWPLNGAKGSGIRSVVKRGDEVLCKGVLKPSGDVDPTYCLLDTPAVDDNMGSEADKGVMIVL